MGRNKQKHFAAVLCVPCSLDDATYATLSSLMLFNNVDVVLGLYQDAAFLPRVSTVGQLSIHNVQLPVRLQCCFYRRSCQGCGAATGWIWKGLADSSNSVYGRMRVKLQGRG
jgi:hypothetical protein